MKAIFAALMAEVESQDYTKFDASPSLIAVREGETVIGEMTPELKAAYLLREKLANELRRESIVLMFMPIPEKLREAAAKVAKFKILTELFWEALRSKLPNDGPEALGIRIGGYVVDGAAEAAEFQASQDGENCGDPDCPVHGHAAETPKFVN